MVPGGPLSHLLRQSAAKLKAYSKPWDAHGGSAMQARLYLCRIVHSAHRLVSIGALIMPNNNVCVLHSNSV